ncbi:MAG: hypothetical protein H6822_20255 [Planctomycetaceae bacterium]|nr:hypothetical protein [Planctomycetaceae bacterium]
MWEEITATVANYLLPIPWEAFVVLAFVVGTLGTLLILAVTNRDDQQAMLIRDGLLGMGIFAGVCATLLWCGVATYVFSSIPATTRRPVDMFVLAGVGVAYGACIYGYSALPLGVFGLVQRIRNRKAESMHADRNRAEALRIAEYNQAKQHEQQSRRLADGQRREDARVACELLYALREHDIEERYPRKRFEEFVNTFVRDDNPVEVVERRAGELQRLIEQHYEAANPPEEFLDLAALTLWYEKQLATIEKLDVADIYKQSYKVQLNERYSELAERLMESLEP